jgi:hypothetical protein
MLAGHTGPCLAALSHLAWAGFNWMFVHVLDIIQGGGTETEDFMKNFVLNIVDILSIHKQKCNTK